MTRSAALGLMSSALALVCVVLAAPALALPRGTGSVGGSGGVGQTGGVVVPTDPTPTPETIPVPPYGTGVEIKTSHTMTVAWRDESSVESGYRIERRSGTGGWLVVGRIGPITEGRIGSWDAGNLRHDTEYCWRVVPWNQHGEPAQVPVGCARTTRIVAPNAVRVTDRIGLIGEIRDPAPPPFQPSSLVLSSDPAAPAPPAPVTAFPVPVARKIIYVADGVQIDLTYTPDLQIPAGITIASSRGGLSQGALLFSNSRDRYTMFEVVGDGVRITGLRFRGPSSSTSADQEGALAIRVHDARDVVIDHNEFFQWPGAGVEVRHEPGLISALTAWRVRITENFFHHNQKQNLGYGVVVADASYAFIDKNTFDWNRHAIASDGGRNRLVPGYGPQHGYLAYLNVVLPGHSDQEYVGGIWEQQTHNFDVHGSESNWLGVDYYDGWAGEFFDIANNSFLDAKGTLFNIRGTPSSSALFHHNVTPPLQLVPGTGTVMGLDGGVSWYGWKSVNSESDRDNVYVFANVPSVDPRERLAVGDFDGDGRDDVLLATGRAWYVSYAGATEWRYLRQSDRPMRMLSLADLDGNGRTDVVTRIGNVWNVAWNGSGGFVPLGYEPSLPSQVFYTSGELVGDFTGDGTMDRLRFQPDGNRYFRVVDGSSGSTRRSWNEM